MPSNGTASPVVLSQQVEPYYLRSVYFTLQCDGTGGNRGPRLIYKFGGVAIVCAVISRPIQNVDFTEVTFADFGMYWEFQPAGLPPAFWYEMLPIPTKFLLDTRFEVYLEFDGGVATDALSAVNFTIEKVDLNAKGD